MFACCAVPVRKGDGADGAALTDGRPPSDSAIDPNTMQLKPLLNDEQWAAFTSRAVPGLSSDAPFLYDEPQFSESMVKMCRSCGIDWFTPRAMICAEPRFPCCCAAVCISSMRACFGNTHVERISKPDAWFKRMLAAKDPRCPEKLQGIYWMHGNNAPETLITFQDGEFDASGRRFRKHGATARNWSHDPTLCGACLAHPFYAWWVDPIALEVSPDGKWLLIDLSVSGRDFGIAGKAHAYFVQPGETWTRADGRVLPAVPGDLIRISYKDWQDPTSENTFMYHMRRVAMLDEHGELVLTPAYDELRALATAPDMHDGCCCGYSHIGMSREHMLQQWELVADEQIIRYADSTGSAPAPERVQRT